MPATLTEFTQNIDIGLQLNTIQTYDDFIQYGQTTFQSQFYDVGYITDY